MSLRDLFVLGIVFGSIPFILRRPYVGVLVWTWIGLMNPHKLAWGIAVNFPVAMVVGAVTLVGLVISREEKRIPWGAVVGALLLFDLWVTLTTLTALSPEGAWPQWNKVMKIHLMIYVTLMLANSPERIRWLVWVAAASLGFYGIKGGLFTLTGGAGNMVVGPPNTFIGGNTEIGLALIMTMPLIWYLRLSHNNPWVRRGAVVAMGLTGIAIIGTYSRGAFLGIAAMGLFLWLKSSKKGMLTIIAIVGIAVTTSLMPQKWFERIDSIQTYEQDASAMGRLNAWGFAYNLATDRPLTGGGFNTFTPALFHEYAPDPADFHDAHSIYFEVLGEHGFIGLLLYLAVMLMAWRSAGWVIRTSKGRPDLAWAGHLMAMLQVSVVGYAAGGAFLGLAYFDFYYLLIALIVATRRVVELELDQNQEIQPAHPGDRKTSIPVGSTQFRHGNR